MPTGFFSSLKDVAGSPYALIAYVLIAGGWIFITFRNSRLKYISKAIKDLPESDRKSILLQEYGIYLKEGMTSEDYLKARKQTYAFVFLISLLLMITVIITISLLQSNKLPDNNASEKPLDPAFCQAVDSVADNIANGFIPLRGARKAKTDTSTDLDFISTIKIPGTKSNVVTISPDDTMYFASVYDGGDKTLAYKHYLEFTQEIARCKDDWVYLPGLKGDEGFGILEYTSFVHGEVKISVTFNISEDSSYASTVIFVKNGKDKK